MITVPAHRVKQFGVEFFQASFSAKDIDRLVKFGGLGHSGGEDAAKGAQRPEEHGVLRVLDGQHRLLALHALTQAGENLGIEVPAVLFDRLDARQIVELFVTINAKHTRLNPSHIVSLAGRKLYPDPNQAMAHDVIRSLNEDETSPLAGEIKMLGTGRGRVSQAPLAEEIVDFLDAVEKIGGGARMNEVRQHAKRFFLNYMKAVAGG